MRGSTKPRPAAAHAEERQMKNERKDPDKKRETLRPWLVDVAIEHLR